MMEDSELVRPDYWRRWSVRTRRTLHSKQIAAAPGSGLSRRGFLKMMAGSLVALGVGKPGGRSAGVKASPADGSCLDEEFLNRPFKVPGELYRARVPDTLDLQARAHVAINALARMAKPDEDHIVYTYSFIDRNPPVLGQPEGHVGKYYEALAMMRLLTGSQEYLETDRRWRRSFLEVLTTAQLVFHGPDLGRMLSWMAVAYRVEQDPCWLSLMQAALENMRHALVHQDGYAFFPNGDGSMPMGWDATFAGWTLQGLTQVYAATYLPLAADLASRLARYLKDRAQVFDDQARFLARHPSDRGPKLHFHHNGNTLVGLAEYASMSGDTEFAQFARQGYEWARSLGSALVGFFPEYIDDPPGILDLVDCETCCTADMIQLALLLTHCGQGDYWDDVDRYLRNQFVEMQLLDGAWIDRRAASLPPVPVGPDQTADQVSQRIVGAFAGWSSVNDFIAYDGAPGVSFCCLGNAARAISSAWEQMLQYHAGQLSVNLLLNRPSHWADVQSCLPVEGRVELKFKRSATLRIRLPEWVNTGEASWTVDDRPRDVGYAGRYAQVDQVLAGQTVTMTFPISERTVATAVGRQPCTFVIRGNDVVAIDPPGGWYPYYQRESYRRPPTRWVTRERFIANAYNRHDVCLPMILG